MKKTLVLNGNTFRYSIYENNDTDQFGVFLMGALQDIDSVDFFSREFSKVVNTIVIEAPGTGETEVLQATVSVRDQAKMVVDLLKYLKVDKAHVFGFSYATAVSVELCDVWSGVQSLSIACGVPGIPECARKVSLQMVAAALKSKSTFANTFVNALTSDHPSIPRNKAIRRSLVAGIMKYDQIRVDVFIENTFRLLAYKPKNLASITVPTLVLAGEYDPYATKEIMRDFYGKLKNAHFVVLKNADHFPNLQQPHKAADALITLANHYRQVCEGFKVIEG
ncbi:alpha/beta fold hydrolase [Marinomonas transparens]|uniref:Alpha/beta hydrolase n=1 Tax=Marinomonas transparens TaxID=2795388 RepID=A0A934JM20_9GAMM|nr:alpha/beta hydrolase [Marinomonas transparens]MBJ7536534.1 alpha/beta hydrolase [Marinomonas transparens]